MNTSKITRSHLPEIYLSWAAIGFTLIFLALICVDTFTKFRVFSHSGEVPDLIELSLLSAIIAVLLYSSLVYLFARLFYFKTLTRGEQPDEKATAAILAGSTLTILVPSYCEEKTIIWRTLVSAALVEHHNRRVVLLVDDPPNPSGPDDKLTLANSRAVTREVHQLFAPVADRFRENIAQIQLSGADLRDKTLAAARLYDEAADFVERIADDLANRESNRFANHTQIFFIERILKAPAQEYRAQALLQNGLQADELACEFNRLGCLFRVEITLFERKVYANLPKNSDKATNLNAYLSLMGRNCRIETRSGAKFIVDAAQDHHAADTLHFPDADYVLILDADSLVLNSYARTLLAIMEGPNGTRIGVAQTPYLAFPNALRPLERAAGATTDIQFVIHQGMGALNAGFWVGANALVRMKAFRDIARPAREADCSYLKFVQDRTVIEDTGSTLDMCVKNWRVHNHHEGLAYSATPQDFGSLLIQRRRWANGGLVLLRDLFRYLRNMKFTAADIGEALMRLHYLASQAFSSIAVLLLLLYPFDTRLISSFLPLTALPYYFLCGRDLQRFGYRWSDLLRVFSLNLVLLPVILGGVVKSLDQIIRGRKTPFVRTPKIEGRTSVPPVYLLAEIFLLGYLGMILHYDVARNDRGHAFFALMSAAAFGYGCIEMIGVQAMVVDIFRGALHFVQRISGRMILPGWQRAD